MQDVPAMLKGADAAIVHVLQALGLRIELLRVWQDEVRLSLPTHPATARCSLSASVARVLRCQDLPACCPLASAVQRRDLGLGAATSGGCRQLAPGTAGVHHSAGAPAGAI